MNRLVTCHYEGWKEALNNLIELFVIHTKNTRCAFDDDDEVNLYSVRVTIVSPYYHNVCTHIWTVNQEKLSIDTLQFLNKKIQINQSLDLW